MPIVCRDYDLLFAHVPKAGGTFVEKVLIEQLAGKPVWPRHHTFRRVEAKLAAQGVPAVRAFVVREPLSWYRSYWAYARDATKRPSAWPVWEAGEAGHPTYPIDRTGGAPQFDRFIKKVLANFPNGFVRSMYCDFLNGSTHALRTSHLNDDLEILLKLVGFEQPSVVHEYPRANEGASKFLERAVLPRELEERIREVDNLDGLVIPYVSDL